MCVDRLEVPMGTRYIRLTRESTNSKLLQGIVIKIDKGNLIIDSNDCKKGVIFWEDTSPKTEIIELKGKPRNLFVYNVWRGEDYRMMLGGPHTPSKAVQEYRTVDCWRFGHAFYYEDDGPVRRYFCNDLEPDDDFDDIIFTIQLLTESAESRAKGTI